MGGRSSGGHRLKSTSACSIRLPEPIDVNADQIWNNIIAYSLQIGLLVGLGAFVPAVLRLRTPRTRFLFWQSLLFACLVLPWVQPWRQAAISLSNVKALAAIGANLPHG